MQKSLYSHHNAVLLSMLRDTRMSRHMRQTDLAMRLGRSQAVVSRVESGERRIDLVELWVWLNALDTDLLTFVAQLSANVEVGKMVKSPVTTKRLRQVPPSV